jgi:hypothetical protein
VPFDERADRRAVLRADDHVSFSVPRLWTIRWNERTLMHAEHGFCEAAPTPGESHVRAPVIAASTQRRGRRAAQQQSLGSVELLVDSFDSKVPVGPVGELAAQRSADLRRAPALCQKLFDSR